MIQWDLKWKLEQYLHMKIMKAINKLQLKNLLFQFEPSHVANEYAVMMLTELSCLLFRRHNNRSAGGVDDKQT